jgi:hypothetical protein
MFLFGHIIAFLIGAAVGFFLAVNMILADADRFQ